MLGIEDEELTFSSVVFNNKSFREGLTYPNAVGSALRRHPGPDPKPPAPNPAGIVGELDVGDKRNPVPHGDAHVPGQQGPLPSPLPRHLPVELLVAGGGREVAFESEDVELEG